VTATKKPVGLMVFGILNIVIGSLGLLCNVCAGVQTFTGNAFQPTPAQQAKGVPFSAEDLTKKLQARLDAEVPHNTKITVAQLAILMILCVVLIFGGVSLIRAKPIARFLCTTFCVGVILLEIAALAYYFVSTKPVADAWLAHDIPPDTPPVVANAMAVGLIVGVILGALFWIGYAIILLIYVMLPGTGRALTGASSGQSAEDIYDPNYQRERRELPPLDQPPEIR
jgi:hypothetical protein